MVGSKAGIGDERVLKVRKTLLSHVGGLLDP